MTISVALSIADTYYIRSRLICDYDVQETNEHGWIDLLKKGFIEYVDTEEEETTMISMTIQVCIRICICIRISICVGLFDICIYIYIFVYNTYTVYV
mgnify:FL=1